jgi:hypothetical protein
MKAIQIRLSLAHRVGALFGSRIGLTTPILDDHHSARQLGRGANAWVSGGW